MFHSNIIVLTGKALFRDVKCAYCGGNVGGQRIMCLDCRPKDARIRQSVNFCDHLVCGEQMIVPTPWNGLEEKKAHLPSHDFVKLRAVLHLKDMPALDRNAQRALERCRSLMAEAKGGRPSSVKTVLDGEMISSHDIGTQRLPLNDTGVEVPTEALLSANLESPRLDPKAFTDKVELTEDHGDGLRITSATRSSIGEQSFTTGEPLLEADDKTSELEIFPRDMFPRKPRCYTCKEQVTQPCWFCVKCTSGKSSS